MNDNEIIKDILRGDKDKFRVLIDHHKNMVFRTVMGFVHEKDDADDLTQDVFIQAYQSLSRFKGEASFSTWLYRIAVNASLNKIRKSPIQVLFQRFDDSIPDNIDKQSPGPVMDEQNPENLLILNEKSQWIQKALDSLPEKQRTAIVLSKYDDLPQKEIAGIMNISEGAVEALLQRAKNNLRKKLSGQIKKI